MDDELPQEEEAGDHEDPDQSLFDGRVQCEFPQFPVCRSSTFLVLFQTRRYERDSARTPTTLDDNIEGTVPLDFDALNPRAIWSALLQINRILLFEVGDFSEVTVVNVDAT